MSSSPTAAAIAATITTLYGGRLAPLDKDALAIVPLPASAPVPNHDAQSYLQKLTRLANKAANSVACGSILAGRTSEADDFGDIALWLGDDTMPPGLKELEVLRILELQGCVQDTRQVKPLELIPGTNLPTHTLGLPDTREIQELAEITSQWQDAFAFVVEGLPGNESAVAHFVIGCHRSRGDAHWWVGLVGIGIRT